MPQKSIKAQKYRETLSIFRRSLIFQTKEFFQNSTLHGVRYIAETGRPVGEKFMWFCFTSIGAVTALVIIMSLWEKFQTNPTITGLDTDFHNLHIRFPTTVVCPKNAYNEDVVMDVAFESFSNYDRDKALTTAPFLKLLTKLSFENMNETYTARAQCLDVLLQCKFIDEPIDCCTHFDLVYTQHGMCYAFNSRFKSTELDDIKGGPPVDLYETDKKWALFFVPNGTAKVFILSNEEYFSSDFNPQIDWQENKAVEVRISKKSTYTTDEARQLTIGQRKCIFNDEVKLQYFPDDYTYSSCMKECRINLAMKLCNCNPPFYKPTKTMCGLEDLPCLMKFSANITDMSNCPHCELSCSNSVFHIENMIEKNREDAGENIGVLVEFLTWPIIRYKREVLFGWVDLLVSFGGIASLFLGFSLLSGVEIVYYFTLRACCMVYKNRKELYEIEEEIKSRPPPYIDLSLRMSRNFSARETLNGKSTDITNVKDQPMIVDPQNNKLFVVPGELGRRRKTEKDYANYSRTLFKQSKTLSQYSDSDTNWQYGQYLP